MFEAGDRLQDALFMAIWRDDLPTADRGRYGDRLVWFALLSSFDSVRGCCLNKSAYMSIVIAHCTRRLPVPAIWAGAVAARMAGASRNLIFSPKQARKRNITHRRLFAHIAITNHRPDVFPKLVYCHGGAVVRPHWLPVPRGRG